MKLAKTYDSKEIEGKMQGVQPKNKGAFLSVERTAPGV